MALEIILPKIDEAMTEGTIVEWKKKEGDRVEKGEILYILETEKVTWEVEAPGSGILSKIMANEGDVVAVGTIVAFILQPDEKAPEISTKAQQETKEAIAPAEKVEATEKPKVIEEATKIKASPLAKRLAKEHGIDLSLIKSIGPDGRISKEDVIQAIEEAKKIKAAPAEKKETVPLSSMRKTIAQRMTDSFQSAPHFYLSVEADAGELVRLREDLTPSIEKLTGLRLTYTDLLLKITARALAEYPEINVTWTGGEIKRGNDANLGLAIAVKDGLIVAVIRQANTKSLTEITSIRADLAQRAVQSKIKPDEMRDGSLTLTNLGMFGIDQFNAIINPPESCILAVGRIIDKPVADNGQVVIRPRINLTLSIDHRVLDGVSGSRFLQRIKELVEQPKLLMF